MDIHNSVATKITKQNYKTTAKIDGVELSKVAIMQDDGGYFAELARLQAGKLDCFSQPVPVRQVSLSQLSPGAIKAYHLHYKQTDVWFVPPQSTLIVNLHDVRANSKTYGIHMRLVLGGHNAKLLAIPPGIAHGAANPNLTPVSLIYYTSEQFDQAHPDEYRLPWDQFGNDVWEVVKG